MMDLGTEYLGLKLSNPLVASPSPLARTVAGVRRLAAAGVGAIVLPSLFQEDVIREAEREERLRAAGTESFAESLDYLPRAGSGDGAVGRYLSLVERAADAAGVPVIASLNGVTSDGWVELAQAMQAAGAAAIELNLYSLPSDPEISGRDIEDEYLRVLARVKAAVTVPVAVKLSPYLSAIGELTGRLERAGADGLVLFNRLMHPGIDPDALALAPAVELSSSAEGRLTQTWIALLRERTKISLAASTGVEDALDVARFLLAGADAVMTTSALLRHGPEYAARLLEELTAWMARRGYADIGAFRGLLRASVGAGADGYDRRGYRAVIRAGTLQYGPSDRLV